MAFNRLTKLGNHHNQKVFIISKRNIASRTPLENPGVGSHLHLLPRRKVPQPQAPLSFPIDRLVYSVVSCIWNYAIHGFCLKHNIFKLHQHCDMHQYIVPFYCWITVCCMDILSIYFWLHLVACRRKQWQPTPVLLPGKSHGQISLAGCSPWGLIESDMTEAISLSLFTVMHWRRKWQPTPVFLPGESQGRGSLVGCRPWGCTESDTTEVT